MNKAIVSALAALLFTIAAIAIIPGTVRQKIRSCDTANVKTNTVANAPKVDITLATQQMQDIAVFRREFFEVDRSYSSAERSRANRELVQLAHQAGQLDPADFSTRLCQIAALSDNGHSRCLAPTIATSVCRWIKANPEAIAHCIAIAHPLNTVAIRFYPFGGEYYVTAIDAEHAPLLGARLVGVDNYSIEAVRAGIRSLHGGVPEYRDMNGVDALSSPEQLHALGLSHQSESVVYQLMTAAGTSANQAFVAGELPMGASGWRWLPEPSKLPWALQDRAVPFRLLDMPALNAVIIQLRQHSDTDNQTLLGFLQSAERLRVQRGRANVILDLREDSGGNLLLTRNFFISWPSRLGDRGRLFVLESPFTFSAAIASIAYLKQSGGDRVVLVGEAPGDRLEFWAEGHPIQLPNSGLLVAPSYARHDYSNGCKGREDCFIGVAQPGSPTTIAPGASGSVDRIPIAVATLAPQLDAPWTIDDWQQGRDPAIRAIAHVLSSSGRNPEQLSQPDSE